MEYDFSLFGFTYLDLDMLEVYQMKNIFIIIFCLFIFGCVEKEEEKSKLYSYTCPVCDFTWSVTLFTKDINALDIFYRNILRGCEKHTKEEWQEKEPIFDMDEAKKISYYGVIRESAYEICSWGNTFKI